MSMESQYILTDTDTKYYLCENVEFDKNRKRTTVMGGLFKGRLGGIGRGEQEG